MSDLKQSIAAFFTSYMGAYNRSDLMAIEQHYALPALLVHEKGQVAYEKPTQLRNKLQELLRYYRELRYEASEFEIQDILSSADERIVCVSVKWTVKRTSPLPDMRFQTTYHLRRISVAHGVEWAIVAVLSLEEPGIIGN